MKVDGFEKCSYHFILKEKSMGKIWEFFDNLNEVVYVADMDTHELVYMNKKTLALHNLNSVEELAGKKCYELLQNSSVPCAICNNNELCEGKFTEWQYYNPLKNRSYVIKDTMVIDEGRRYRLELAIDNRLQEQKYEMFLEQQNIEALANEAMRIALKAETPDLSLEIILEYLGRSIKGDRTYIFEKNASGGDDNTYEWVANGVMPQIDTLQNLPPEIYANWYRNFQENNNIAIADVEKIKESDPLQYENLKRQDIHSIVVVPLYSNMENIGFFGVDNPHGESIEYTENMLQIVGHFIVSCLKRRNLLQELQQMSYSDQLTKLGNRFGMDKFMEERERQNSIGVVYCDITGLKRVNDSEGHLAGDQLILRATSCLKEIFVGYGLFRIGGDELLAICPGIDKEILYEKAKLVKQLSVERNAVMAVGAVWQDKTEGDIDQLLVEAEQLMYEDKSAY